MLADYNVLTGGEATTRTTSSGGSSTGSDSSTGGLIDELRGLLDELSDLLQRISDLIGGDSSDSTRSGSGSSGSGSTGSGCGEEAISDTGRIWGDPHFIGQDGSEIERLLGDAFATIGQSLLMFSRVMNTDELFA